MKAMAKTAFIEIKNASQHNLKGIHLRIPQNVFTVVTGVSGSGKSSLIFDTLFAEGQRRYVESLSAYARQFLGKMKKPLVDDIIGLCPAIAIDQKVNTQNPRSTVATSTEIYDYLKLLFTRVGHTISPISGREVKRDTVQDVFNESLTFPEGNMLLIMFPLKEVSKETLNQLKVKGYSRLWVDQVISKIEDLEQRNYQLKAHDYVIVDRVTVDINSEEFKSRLFDSIETSFWEGDGSCIVYDYSSNKEYAYSNRFELDGMEFEIPTKDFLSFNNPFGACKKCEGFGSILGIDEHLVIPNRELSVYEGCVAPWKGEIMGEWKDHFIKKSAAFDFPIHRPYSELNKQERDFLWKGNKAVLGIYDFFKHLEENNYKIQFRVLAARYRGKTTCDVCQGTRLREDASYVKLVNIKEQNHIANHTSLQEVLLMTVKDALSYFKCLVLSPTDSEIAHRILSEISNRLEYLNLVGLGYLNLNRLSNTLSGGESQRINLATNLGSNLTGSMYILDEPSIGLHSRDTERLIDVLKQLKKEGNTVIVVEHDEDIMRHSDYLVDIGPLAGSNGGELVYSGDFDGVLECNQSITAAYLSGRSQIFRTKEVLHSHFIQLEGASANNLKNVTVKFPLHAFTCVSGVSGSGKTTLIKQVLFPAISRHLGQFTSQLSGQFKHLSGDIHLVKSVEFVDQNPIGKSSRSNPVTYIKAYDDIRELYSKTPVSKRMGYKPSHFSFNVDGGRCDNCQGEGENIIEMQFMADIKLPCEVCQGMRFKKEVLEATHKGKNIFDILELTVDEAMEFFDDQSAICDKIKPLQDVGLGYVKLGQGSNTLSGGEAQRVKLAYYLSKATPHKEGGVLFIFDEPTTGLHFHDIQMLLNSFNALLKKGNTILCIEHNLDVINNSDWVIDLGPEAGVNGGDLVFQGTVDGLKKCPDSLTGQYLAKKN
jgi:excinuclease ABC subunit A